jgi:hypothetical protein
MSFPRSALAAACWLGVVYAQPCNDAVIGLSSALGVVLAGSAAAVLYAFRDRICCTRGDSQRVYDTPCPYCKKKQPKDCIREHLTECEEHRKFWTPRLLVRESSGLRVERIHVAA